MVSKQKTLEVRYCLHRNFFFLSGDKAELVTAMLKRVTSQLTDCFPH
jgi:hypothetical protein